MRTTWSMLYRGQLYQADVPTVAGMNLNVLLDDALLVLVHKALAGEKLVMDETIRRYTRGN